MVAIVGGVLDGDKAKLPAGAEEDFMARLSTKECGEKSCRCTQSTDYTLRQDGESEALVGQGMVWPFLAGAAA